MKRRGFIAAIAASTVLLSASIASAQDKIRIAALSFGESGEYMKAWSTEIQSHPAVKDGKVEITVFDGKYDPLVQSNQIDTAITQQFNAIIMAPFDLEASAPAIDRAVEAKIPVIVSALKTASKNYTSSIIVDDREGGKIIAEEISKRLPSGGNLVLMEGPIGQSAQIERRAGVDAGLAAHPNLKLMMDKSGNWSRAEGQALMENWISAYPNQINGVLAENDEMALGAIEAMKAAKIDLEKVPVIAIDGIPDAKRAVDGGEMAVTLYKYARAEGQGAVDLALRQVIGSDFKPQSEVWSGLMEWKDGAQKDYTVPWLILDKSNVKKYM
ncbi:substrate-binding domain-containing protein (plasmid) [Agrobacterium salinitolerans]|uniref:Substrate-binding domain-containing protein n=1 Tax=Agrobacterium salinitolerans TaxID=1183413 RepID=A0A4Z1QRR5_9HYPH|nr:MULTISPECIES: substrate-binding domain-containing protein [Agrobacterium]MDH6298080.1 putative xylitol transport system substrate-binding protein [Agrobacterium fabrum]UYZ11101.1 substrate-binding domain-containing protein [Agrobacterium salinitolerans]